MLILTSEQMGFVAWEHPRSDCETLWDCLSVMAELDLENAFDRFRQGKATRADLLAIRSEHERELRANPALKDCPDFRAEMVRLLALTPAQEW